MDAGERGGRNPAVKAHLAGKNGRTSCLQRTPLGKDGKDGEKREVGVLRTEQVEANRGCWEI